MKRRNFVKAAATAGVAPPEFTTMQIYKGVVPFVGIQCSHSAWSRCSRH